MARMGDKDKVRDTANDTDNMDGHDADVPNFGDSSVGSLLDPKSDGDWDIPELTFPSIDESARHVHDDASLSFPHVHAAASDALTDMPAVPAPQATATSETTILPPVGAGSSAEVAKQALESEETTVIAPSGVPAAPGTLGAVADAAPREGAGLRGIIEGTDDGESDAETPETPETADGGADAATAQPEVSPRKKFLIGLGAIAVIAAVAGVTAFSYIQRTGNEARFNAALESCETAAHDADKADDALAAALKKAKSARNITADQLADSSTLAKLSDAIDATQTSDTTRTSDSTQACSTTLTAAELDARAKRNAKVASTLTSSTKTLESATKAVTDSQAKKTQADAAAQSAQEDQSETDTQSGSDESGYGYDGTTNGTTGSYGYGGYGYYGYGNGYDNGTYGYGGYGYGGYGTGDGTSGNGGQSGTTGGQQTDGSGDTTTPGSGATGGTGAGNGNGNASGGTDGTGNTGSTTGGNQ